MDSNHFWSSILIFHLRFLFFWAPRKVLRYEKLVTFSGDNCPSRCLKRSLTLWTSWLFLVDFRGNSFLTNLGLIFWAIFGFGIILADFRDFLEQFLRQQDIHAFVNSASVSFRIEVAYTLLDKSFIKTRENVGRWKLWILLIQNLSQPIVNVRISPVMHEKKYVRDVISMFPVKFIWTKKSIHTTQYESQLWELSISDK